jgi:hypothetical protein
MSRSLFLISRVARLGIPLLLLAVIIPAAEARRVWPLSEEGYRTASPALAAAGRADEAIAAWSEDEGSRVVARVLTTSGRPLSPERELAAAVDGESVGGAAAAGTRAGYLVAWGRGLGAIDVAALDRGGERVGPVRTIAEDNRFYLRVVYQPRTREYLVLWLEREGESLDATEALFARRLDRRGEPLAPAVMVSPRYSNIRSYAVEARRDRRGYLVAWHRDPPPGMGGIETQVLRSDGLPTGPVRAIGPGYGQASVELTWNGRQRTFVLATYDYRVKLYRVNPDGSRRGRAHIVRPGPTVEEVPKAVVLAYERRSDTLLVIWVEGDEYGRPPFDTTDLQARRLDAARLKTLDSWQVPCCQPSTYPDVCCPAVVAFRGGGNLVAWAGERGDGTGSRIFAQGL